MPVYYCSPRRKVYHSTILLPASNASRSTVVRAFKLTAYLDEPEEVEVVEQQLNEHLDLDTLATLGVLCDQIVPPDEPLDEEDQTTRERLRGLVLSFLTGRAKRGIIERHMISSDGATESVLVSTLLQVCATFPVLRVHLTSCIGNTQTPTCRYQKPSK